MSAQATLLALLGGWLCYKVFSRYFTKALDPRVRKMSNMGLTTLLTETETNRSIVLAYLIVPGELTKGQIVQTLNKRIKTDTFFFRFRSVASSKSRTFVEVDNFDASDHVHLHSEPSSLVFTQLLESYANKALDYTKPPWMINIWYKKGEEKGEVVTVIVASEHHCLGDGPSLSLALYKWFEEESSLLKFTMNVEKKLSSTAREDIDLRKFIENAVWSSRIILSKMYATLFRQEPATCFKNPPSGRKRLSISENYNLDQIKKVGAMHRATVNDIFLHCVASAMRRILIQKECNIDPCMVLRAAVPINMRDASQVIQSLGNEFSSLTIDLPVGNSDPIQRLSAIRKNTFEAKMSYERYVVYHTIRGLVLSPEIINKKLAHFSTSRMSVAITNVRLQEFDLKVFGQRALQFGGFVPPPPGVNLGICILTIGTKLILTISLDDAVGADVDVFTKSIQDEFAVLCELSGVS